MSSPNARAQLSPWDRLRISIHRRVSHCARVRLLARLVAAHVPPGAAILDIGCGDLGLASLVAAEAEARQCVGVDIWPLRSDLPPGSRYVQIRPGERLPFDDDEFDVALLVDVLHHSENPTGLLIEAMRVARRVLVKDHAERSRIDHAKLRLLDWLGNAAYGVPLPCHYFGPGEFAGLASVSGAHVTMREDEIDVYGHVPLARMLFPPRLHFLAELRPA